MSQHAVRLLDQAGEAAHQAAQRAVALARSAQPAWARTAPVERGQALRAAAVAVRAAAEELRELLHGETGKLPDEARGSVHAAADTLDQYASSVRCTPPRPPGAARCSAAGMRPT